MVQSQWQVPLGLWLFAWGTASEVCRHLLPHPVFIFLHLCTCPSLTEPESEDRISSGGGAAETNIPWAFTQYLRNRNDTSR